MPTGACGINCEVCKLKQKGVCSSCGSGRSPEAVRKLESQQRILGSPCPILACAQLNQVDYCMQDCATFPCDNFAAGPYPFSDGFLNMQRRRLEQEPRTYAPDGSHLEVAQEYWQAVTARDITHLCNITFFEPADGQCLQFRFLQQDIRIDPIRQLLMCRCQGQWTISDDSLLALVTVLYLKNVQSIYPLGQDIVGTKDLKEGHFFTGPHELRTQALLRRYGSDPQGFAHACQALGGQPMQMADVAYRLMPFPRLALYYLLWAGDDEFKPRLQVLFDRSIEQILPADAIWALVNRVAQAFQEV